MIKSKASKDNPYRRDIRDDMRYKPGMSLVDQRTLQDVMDIEAENLWTSDARAIQAYHRSNVLTVGRVWRNNE